MAPGAGVCGAGQCEAVTAGRTRSYLPPKGMCEVLDILRGHPAGEPVPAISLRQPWAGAVAFLGKDVENRSRWPFKYRGPIIIHASATTPSLEDYKRMRNLAEEDELEADLLEGLDPTNEETFLAGLFEMGGIVAVANLAEVFGPDDEVPEDHPVTASPWVKEDEDYWLYFSEVVPVKPVPFKGAVGMFKVPFEVARELEPFLADA